MHFTKKKKEVSQEETANGNGDDYTVFKYHDPNSGQVYEFTVDPFQGFVPMAPVRRRETRTKLAHRLSRDFRPSMQSLESQRILRGNFYEENYESNLQQQEQEKSKIKEELNKKLDPSQRPSVNHLGHIGIMNEESLYQLYGLADDVRKKHTRMESAVEDLKAHLNLSNELGHAISSEVLQEL
ncbi:hypothetical protein RFI_38223, partial [Reticulomyxa filosa]